MDSGGGNFGEDLREVGIDYMGNRGGEAGGGVGLVRLRRVRRTEWNFRRH